MKNILLSSLWTPCSLLLLLSLTACSGLEQKNFTIPQPLRSVHETSSDIPTVDEALSPVERELDTDLVVAKTEEQKAEKRFKNTPPPPYSPRILSTSKEQQPVFKSQQPITINVDNLALPAFINEVFGNLLGLDFQIGSKLKKAKDLVTLRIAQPQTPQQFYRTVRTILADYGVSIVFQGHLLRFIADAKASSSEPPLLISGRTLPSVPITHRTVFQYIELKATKLSSVERWLHHIYHQQNLKILKDISHNAIILKGPPELVRQAIQVLDMFDRPLMRSRYSSAIKPLYLEPNVLAAHLITVLKAEGYEVGSSSSPSLPLVILPINDSHLILIFSSDQALLSHAQDWATRLDRLTDDKTEQAKLFFYTAENTTAKDIADVIQPLLKQLNTPPPKGKPATQQAVLGKSMTFVLDEKRNALILQGTTAQWQQILPLLKKLDTPSKMALIEVIVAEITLTDEFETGIEWLLRDAGIGNFNGALGTRSEGVGTGLGVASRGLVYYPISTSGQTLAALNAFASNNRVSLLSNPRLMVRSGEQAHIRVGSEVPIVTTNSSSTLQNNDNGNNTILQQIQYRKTGVTLTVKPTIHSGSQIDLDITQEVSSAEVNNTSNINSPIILNRNIQTKLSISDGGSVFLGGMISTNKTDSVSGVPVLSDIPILGNLFKVKKESLVRTEMVMLIIPYIINNAQEAVDITRQIQEALSLYGDKLEKQPLPDTLPDSLSEPHLAD